MKGTLAQAYFLKGEYQHASALNSGTLRISKEMKVWRLEVITLVQQSQIDLFLGDLGQ